MIEWDHANGQWRGNAATRTVGFFYYPQVFGLVILTAVAGAFFLMGKPETLNYEDVDMPLSPQSGANAYLIGIEQFRNHEPVYAILFVSPYDNPGIITVVEHGQVVEIEGHWIDCSVNSKAIYALQPDFSLKELNLSPAETNEVLARLCTTNAPASPWKPKILPDLATLSLRN